MALCSGVKGGGGEEFLRQLSKNIYFWRMVSSFVRTLVKLVSMNELKWKSVAIKTQIISSNLDIH
jgi:hypothetical protein